MATLCGAAPPAMHVPAWLRLTAGQSAYLKEDGPLSHRATVCDTAANYDDFAHGLSHAGCRTFARGLAVRVAALSGSLDLDGAVTPLVDIATRDGGRLGFVDATLLEPLVPNGTTLEVLTVGDYVPQIWKTQADSADNEVVDGNGPKRTAYLPAHTRVEVLEQVPYDRGADLRVRALDGRKRGTSGWIVEAFVPDTNLAADDFVFPVAVDAATMFR